MNIFSKLTRKTMKMNRVRTMVTIIGVIIATAMFTAVTTFCSSLMNFGLRTYTYKTGDWHIRGFMMSEQEIEKVTSQKAVLKSGISERIGFAKIDSTNDMKPYLYIEAEDENAFDILPVHVTEGRLPISSRELLLPVHLASNGEVFQKVGDKLTLAVGDRVAEDTAITGNGAYLADETIENAVTREYTVVGFYERPDFEHYQAAGYTALTMRESEVFLEDRISVRMKIAKPATKLDTFLADNHLNDRSELNWDVLMFAGQFKYQNIGSFVFIMGGFIVLIIMLGSISMIYSVFSISVSERTKQFGLLSSVGATKRQIKRCVFSEATTVLAIGVPIGLLAGVVGLGVTFAFVGDKFKSIISSPYPMELSVSVLALVLAAIIATITVFLSAWVPSRRATKVTAMEAIRQSREVREKKNTKLRIPGFVYKLFGLEGMLANKYFRRSKRKYRTTVISLTLSIVLFVTTSAFCAELTKSVSDTFSLRSYDVYYQSGLTDMESVAKLDTLLLEVPGIKKVSRSYVSAGILYDYVNYTTKDFVDYRRNQFWYDEWSEEEQSSEAFGLYYMHPEEYQRIAKEAGVSEKDYTSDNPPAIAVNQTSYVKYEQVGDSHNRVTYKINILKSDVRSLPITNVTYDEEGEIINRETKELAIGAFIDVPPLGVESAGYVGAMLILPETAPLFDSVRSAEDYYFVASDYEQMIDALRETLAANGYRNDDDSMIDVKAREKDNRDLLLLANVFAYGFITLLSLISVANVFNTISTNIALRRKDFGMLRSIGMSNKGLKRMMNYECLLYGSRALLFGVPLSIGMAYWIHSGVVDTVASKFELPIVALLIAAFSIFAVVFTTMVYAMNRIKKDNPLEALRSESV